jgi:hypothetical protein
LKCVGVFSADQNEARQVTFADPEKIRKLARRGKLGEPLRPLRRTIISLEPSMWALTPGNTEGDLFG